MKYTLIVILIAVMLATTACAPATEEAGAETVSPTASDAVAETDATSRPVRTRPPVTPEPDPTAQPTPLPSPEPPYTPTQVPITPAPRVVAQVTAAESAFLDGVLDGLNAARTEAGLVALARDSVLDSVSGGWALTMATNQRAQYEGVAGEVAAIAPIVSAQEDYNEGLQFGRRCVQLSAAYGESGYTRMGAGAAWGTNGELYVNVRIAAAASGGSGNSSSSSTTAPTATPTDKPSPTPTASPSPSPSPTPLPRTTDPNFNVKYAEEVVLRVNELREAQGLPPLINDAVMATIAQIRAKELTVTFSHFRPDATLASQLVLDMTGGSEYAENIAHGYENPETVMMSWVGNKQHRENINNPLFTRIGVAVYKKDGHLYWDQVFSN